MEELHIGRCVIVASASSHPVNRQMLTPYIELSLPVKGRRRIWMMIGAGWLNYYVNIGFSWERKTNREEIDKNEAG